MTKDEFRELTRAKIRACGVDGKQNGSVRLVVPEDADVIDEDNGLISVAVVAEAPDGNGYMTLWYYFNVGLEKDDSESKSP